MGSQLVRRSIGAVSLVILLGSLGLPSGGPVMAQGDGLDCPPPGDADLSDLRDVAAEQGWTLDQAIRHECRGRIVGRIASRLSRAEPEAWVGADIGDGPDDVARIYLKGPASERAQELVHASGGLVEIVDRQPYSFTELGDRNILVQQALLQLGLEDFSIAVDIAGAGRIPVHVRKLSSTPSRRAILRSIPADLRADVVLTIDTKGTWDLDVGTETADASASPTPSPSSAAGPVVAPTDAWGPMAMVQDPLRDSLDQGFGPGQLIIGDACVTLRTEASETTLVFRDWQVIWNPASATIVFGDPSGELLELTTGDSLTLGGYAPWDVDTTGEPAAPPWLVQPGPACPSGLMLVHSVARGD